MDAPAPPVSHVAPRRILAVAIVVHLALGTALAAGALRPFFNDIRNRPGPGADFFAVYHAGRQVWTGRSPYQHEERPQVTPPYFAPFRYPPGVAYTLGAGMAWSKPWWAYATWLVVLEGLLVLGLWQLRTLVEDPVRLAWLRASWLAFPPYFLELWMGQFTFVAAMGVFFAVLGWRRGRPRSAVALWSVACALKLFPLALAPALAARRRVGALIVAGVVVAAALAPLLATDDGVRGFFTLNAGAPDPSEVHAGNLGLVVLVHRLVELFSGAPPDPAWWPWLVRGLTGALAGAVALAMWRARRASLELAAAAALWLLPLVSKDSWEHHAVIALPAVALMTAALVGRARLMTLTVVAWALSAAPTLLVVLQDEPSIWYPDGAWSAATRVLYHAPHPLGALLGLGVCLVAMWRPADLSDTIARAPAPRA